MRGRLGKKPEHKSTFSKEEKPELFVNPYNPTQKESKNIRIFVNNQKESLIGYYDYTLNAFISFQQTESNTQGRVLVDYDRIIGWKYL